MSFAGRCAHVQQRRGGVSSCVFLFITEENRSEMLLAGFCSGPFTRIDSQAHALTDKGYGVDVNSDWHRNTRGSNGREEEKDIPQEKE